MLDAVDADGQEANLMRLQRMLVLAQCRSITLHGAPLFDERVIVLGDTAAIGRIHDAFRRWSWLPIGGRARHPDIDFEHPPTDDKQHLEIIRDTVVACRGISGLALGALLRRAIPRLDNGAVVDRGMLGSAFDRLAAA
jgi:uncharacterized phage-associated protein